jgi:hypothetical protein
MFVAEGATNIIRNPPSVEAGQLFMGKSMKLVHFARRAACIILSPLSGERKIKIISLRSLRLCGEIKFFDFNNHL